jgi:hypothetical protein
MQLYSYTVLQSCSLAVFPSREIIFDIRCSVLSTKVGKGFVRYYFSQITLNKESPKLSLAERLHDCKTARLHDCMTFSFSRPLQGSPTT